MLEICQLKKGKKIVDEEYVIQGEKGLKIKYFHKDDKESEKIVITGKDGKYKIKSTVNGEVTEKDLDEYDLKILSLKNQYEQLAALQESYEKMKEFDLGNLELVNSDCVQVLNKIISLCDSKLDKLSKTKQLIEEYDKLSFFNLLNSNINVSELSQLEVIIENSEVCIKKINDIKALINSCNDLEKIYKDYSNVKQEGELLTESYKKTQMQSENLDKELSAFKKMLIDKGIQCETCGSILK